MILGSSLRCRCRDLTSLLPLYRSANAPTPPLRLNPSQYTLYCTAACVEFASVSASSLFTDMMVSMVGLYIRCCLAGSIVLVWSGLSPVVEKRKCKGKQWVFTNLAVALHARGYRGWWCGSVQILDAALNCVFLNRMSTGGIFACASRAL